MRQGTYKWRGMVVLWRHKERSKNLLLGAALAEGTAIFGFVVALLIILFLG